MDLISVIIPIDNTLEYTKQAMNSVINQTYKNMEIICIIDCNKDRTFGIIQEFANIDSRIKIIHQERLGLSIARNAGLDVAKGDYIMYLDADDWFEPDAVESAYNSIKQNNADVVCFGTHLVDYKEIRSEDDPLQEFIELYNKEKKFTKKTLPLLCTVWHKIYKRDFLTRNNIKFPEQIKNSEDIYYCMLCLLNNAKIEMLPKTLYNYRFERCDSAINTVKSTLTDYYKIITQLTSTKDFKKASLENKKLCLLKIIYRFNTQIKERNKTTCYSMLRYLEKHIPQNLLENCESYNILKNKYDYSKIKRKITKFYGLNIKCK